MAQHQDRSSNADDGLGKFRSDDRLCDDRHVLADVSAPLVLSTQIITLPAAPEEWVGDEDGTPSEVRFVVTVKSNARPTVIRCGNLVCENPIILPSSPLRRFP